MADSKDQVESLKQQGNAALQAGQVDEALAFYTQGLELSTDNSLLFSNRSAAFCKAGKYEEALEDADRVVTLRPDWTKGYSRKGAALALMNRHEEAMMAYMEGLEYDANSEQLKEGIRKSKEHLSGPGGSQPLVNPFVDPQLWNKIAADSRTKEFMADPGYRQLMEKLQKDPTLLGQHMQDSRVMTTLGMLLGVSLGPMPEDNGKPGDVNSEMPTISTWDPSDGSTTVINGHSETKKQQQSDKSQENKRRKTEEDKPSMSNLLQCKEAVKEKELGNAAYKKKDFETALSHYDKAVELEPTNIVFRNNKAAVYFEQQKYDECVEECNEGVRIGRENRADFKLIAKALSRAGNAYSKKEDYENALVCYNKSLSEHRDMDVVRKSQQTDKLVKEKARLAYIDPDKALEEKTLGNKAYTKGDYPTAMKHYTDAIKRNPEDAKVYSNRAACYTKLAEFNMALKDADECIRLDPKFVKGYLRKAASLVATKDMARAGGAYQKAMELDANCQEAIDGYRRCVMQDNDPEAVKKRAMQDPEVQQILGDPAMQLILQQMQKDPRALQEHLQNPAIATKIEKLLEVGLIAIR